MFDSRPTKLKIKLKNLSYNIEIIKNITKDSAKILAVVKANAYGHGSIEIVKELVKRNAINFFGVACAYEASKLFKENPDIKILSLGKIYRDDLEIAKKYNYSLTVGSVNDLSELSDIDNKIKIHLKFDTGMGRFGIFPDKIKFVIDFLRKRENIILEGISTHFPAADTDKEFTENQIKIFESIKKIFIENGFKDIFFHCANSDGIVNFSESHFNLVRPGLMLYGSYGKKDIKKRLGLKPVMELISKVTDIKYFKKGDSIGYGRTFNVVNDSFKAALIPAGYADGYSRALSNKGKVLIENTLCNVAGRVSMDWIVADITKCNGVKIGSDVTLFGDDSFLLDVDDIAKSIGTISYEILCNTGKNYRKEIIYDRNN